MPEREEELRALAAARWRVAVVLTAAMIANYFGFIGLIAYRKSLLAIPVATGLSLGVLLGVLVIGASWILTWVYVRWANTRYDTRLHELRRRHG
jgi:uncharacterized membrane protein (DUF485 family)